MATDQAFEDRVDHGPHGVEPTRMAEAQIIRFPISSKEADMRRINAPTSGPAAPAVPIRQELK